MKYRTTNELHHFNFTESYIAQIQKRNGNFQFTLDNVTILPVNSCNRDIRQMRTNGLELKIQDGQVLLLVQEGYQVYDADGKLAHRYEDQPVGPEEYNDTLKSLADGESCIYTVEKTDGNYRFFIDASDGRTYLLAIAGTGDVEEWDRFYSK